MPESITIETSTFCNARCIICPNYLKPRYPHLMPLEHFSQILRFFPSLKGVVLCGMYEPLTDFRLGAVLDIIEILHPKAAVTIFTNGSLLTKDNAKLLLRHRNVENLIVSIHGFSKKVYESIMLGLNRKQVYQNVLNFSKLRYREINLSVSFVRIKQNIHELEMFRNFWKDKVDRVSDFEVMNWNGQVEGFENLLYEEPKNLRACPMFEQPLVIDAYGRIVKCCYDFKWNYGYVLKGGLDNWLNKTRESETYPNSDCKACYGWRYY